MKIKIVDIFRNEIRNLVHHERTLARLFVTPLSGGNSLTQTHAGTCPRHAATRQIFSQKPLDDFEHPAKGHTSDPTADEPRKTQQSHCSAS
jgi:hypothetical protein